MRGKRGVKSGIEQVLGNIPAYAGKTEGYKFGNARG